ncbi:hypothetical protein DL769_003169 [Monosporascus sp. CRB-8-3]|nr:hypothetical protein DL769_003169 [Monosporascus sp. CRB-8-3]
MIPDSRVAYFFLEGKGSAATGRIAENQALKNGAYGAHANLRSLMTAITAKVLGEACARMDVEQFEEDVDLSDEEGNEYHGDDHATEDLEDNEGTDSE